MAIGAKEYLVKLTNDELVELIRDLDNATFTEEDPIRKAINQIYPEGGMFMLQVNGLIYPILKEISERFVKCQF